MILAVFSILFLQLQSHLSFLLPLSLQSISILLQLLYRRLQSPFVVGLIRKLLVVGCLGNWCQFGDAQIVDGECSIARWYAVTHALSPILFLFPGTAVFSPFPTELGPEDATIVFYALENPPVDHNLTS